MLPGCFGLACLEFLLAEQDNNDTFIILSHQKIPAIVVNKSVLNERILAVQIIIAFFIALPFGWLFSYIQIPLPWMLGPLTAIIVFNSMLGDWVRWPTLLRDLGMIVIGYSMGRSVTMDALHTITASLPIMITITLLTILFCTVSGYITHRQTGISLSSSLLGSMPGGLSQMVLLCDEIKTSDLTVVTFMQTIRLLSVVFLVPFIAAHGLINSTETSIILPTEMMEYDWHTTWPVIALAPISAILAYYLKLPTPYLLGPIFGVAIGVLNAFPAPPADPVLLIAAQVFVGIYMGNGISLSSLKQLGKVLPYAVGGAIALLAFTFALAYALTIISPASLLTGFLSTAPGGMAEMGITAVVLQADVSTVISYQLFRLFFVLLSIPPVLKWRLNG